VVGPAHLGQRASGYGPVALRTSTSTGPSATAEPSRARHRAITAPGWRELPVTRATRPFVTEPAR
jgi:hypothetical protein